jgi:hypothetical protein
VSALRIALPCAVLVAVALGIGTPANGAGPVALTVYIAGGTTRTALRLQPGFATVLRADHRVDTVAIGDPRLVTATTVKRGPDVYDLVLQPQAATGVTNMIVWFAELTAIWDLTIGPGQRTADIVYVVTSPPPSSSSSPALLQTALPPSQAGSPASATPHPPGAIPGPRANAQPDAPQPLEAQQTFGEVSGAFQLSRGSRGIKIRYRITNKSVTEFSVRPTGVLIRVDGRLVPFGMSRDNADRDHPAVLPPGATEAGVINAPVRAPRQVEVIFTLFPAKEDHQSPTRILPTSFQILFAGLDRLPASAAP